MEKSRRIRSLSDLYSIVPGGIAPIPEDMAGKTPIQSLVTLLVGFEKSGRRGSGVTTIQGFHHTKEDLLDLARRLKALCGAGGTVKDETIEIQGDHRSKVATELERQGYKVKVRR